MYRILSVLFFLLLHIGDGYGQEDWQYLYQDQEPRAEALFHFYYGKHQYQEALPHLEWLLDHRNEAAYHEKAIQVYEELSRHAKDEEAASRYAALCLRQFDMLMTLTGDTISMLNQKLHQAYQLFYDQPQEYPRLKQMSELLLLEVGTEFAFYNFSAYIRLLLLMQEAGLVEKHIIAEVCNRLDEISKAPQNRYNLDYQEAILKVKEVLENNH